MYILNNILFKIKKQKIVIYWEYLNYVIRYLLDYDDFLDNYTWIFEQIENMDIYVLLKYIFNKHN
jgi:hypothetical protein